MSHTRNLFSTTLLAACSMLAASTTGAAELKAGDVINAANIDKVKADTFEGHPVRSLITERMELMIKNYNLSIKLRNSQEIPLNRVDVINTEKYAGTVKIDVATKEVTGYKAGVPFPGIDLKDPLSGYKAMYNHYYQNSYANNFDGDYTFLFIDADKGVQRAQTWFTSTFKMKGRLLGDPVLDEGKLVTKTLLFAKEPYDIKGIGIFTVRHDTSQLEDNWAYIKSVRRVRQLSGGSWMDNLAGSVQLNDEYDVVSARPSWYPDARIRGKRWILAVPHLKLPLVAGKGDASSSYQTVDTKTKPFWTPTSVVEWEPREVYEIEVTMPSQHPYSKRVLYQDVKFPRYYMADHYDKSGEFAKITLVFSSPVKGADGYVSMLPQQGQTFDIKRKEAFIYIAHPNLAANRAGSKPSDVTLGQLEAAAK